MILLCQPNAKFGVALRRPPLGRMARGRTESDHVLISVQLKRGHSSGDAKQDLIRDVQFQSLCIILHAVCMNGFDVPRCDRDNIGIPVHLVRNERATHAQTFVDRHCSRNAHEDSQETTAQASMNIDEEVIPFRTKRTRQSDEPRKTIPAVISERHVQVRIEPHQLGEFRPRHEVDLRRWKSLPQYAQQRTREHDIPDGTKAENQCFRKRIHEQWYAEKRAGANDGMNKARTIGELRATKYITRPVKEEIRENLIQSLHAGRPLFPGIVGYEKTVIPAIINAILAKHDILLLGLRGQAKSRIVRLFPSLLDEYLPVIKGCEINDDPFHPVCKRCTELVREHGEAVEIEWLHRDRRFSEKLATPDVTIADLIGDIDPIKAATQRLHFAHEGAIHYGIIPRSNRGIFAINELPDLQPRIQVGLFNIMEEKDIQIRGFNIRIPLDVMIVFTANPEDYTNRGNLITPLKDRIDSQILTHYPRSIDDAIAITEQEAWVRRNGRTVQLPRYIREIVEQIAFEARKSEYVDQKSGVSARLTISALENLVSNAERRAILFSETSIVPRICDLAHMLPGLTGKIELVFEGEQEGSVKVGKALIGKAVRAVFRGYFPDPNKRRSRTNDERPKEEDSLYGPIVRWFEAGNRIEIADDMPFEVYHRELARIPELAELTVRYLGVDSTNLLELAPAMEFVLDALHQHSKIAKDEIEHVTSYKDMVGSMFVDRSPEGDEEL